MKIRVSALLLLALLGAVDETAAASRRSVMAVMGGPKRPVVSGLNAGGRADSWEPMRIKAFYDTSIDRLPAEHQELVKNVLVASAVDWLQKVLYVRPVMVPICFERSCHSFFHYLVNGQSYCPEDCAQHTKCGSFSNIPEQHLLGCRYCSRSHKCKTNPNSQLQRVPEADFVLYVSLWDDLQCRGLASGGHCQQEEDYGRPVAGYLNICKYNLDGLAIGNGNLDLAIQRVLHQLIHALVFSPQLYAFYRDSAGNPMGSTHSNPVAQIDGSFLVSDNVLLTKPASNWLSRLRVDHSQTYLVTPAVKRIVQEHFNCFDSDSLPGAEVEDYGGSTTVHRHWEERLFADGMLSATQPGDDSLLPSVLTLALFEDSGWYKVDYNYSEPLKWGRGKGCAFVNSSCLGWINYAKSQRLHTAPFCTEADLKNNRLTCSTNRKALSKCNLINFPIPLPKAYQYFNTTAGGATPYADFCPIFKPFMSCEDHANSVGLNFALETFGVNSHCIEHNSRWRLQTDTGESVQSSSWGAGCYSVRCGWQKGKGVTYISLGTQSSFATEHLCETKGQILTITQRSGSKQFIGSIICPDFHDVCKNIKCLHHCSKKGICRNGRCFCYPGYFGEDCSQYYGNRLRDCRLTKCLNGQPCVRDDFGFWCNCSANYTGDLCEKSKIDLRSCETENCSGHGECYYGLDSVSPKCECHPGYTGEKCEERIDYCRQSQRSPCMNKGMCQNGLEGYICICRRFYSGNHCEIYNSPCRYNPCKNSGKCLQDVQSAHGFRCLCTSRWKGKNCALRRLCSRVSCANGGTCVETTFRVRCLCPPGYHGITCEKRDPCHSAPCLNGGICSSHENGSFHCMCKEGYTGHLCDEERGPCDSVPCLNGGTCSESDHILFKCNCTIDFVGKHCETPNPCAESPCMNGGDCIAQQNGSFHCVCQPGWISKNCAIRDPCHHNPCYNGANCTVELYAHLSTLQETPSRRGSNDSYRPHCQCPEGYHGRLCQFKDPCIPNPCENGGRCMNTSLWDHTCQCLSGYIGMNCTIEDPCASQPCLNNATCISHLNGSALEKGTATCLCPQRFTGQWCESQEDPCSPNPCGEGMCTVDKQGTVHCLSPVHLTKLHCNETITSRPNVCQGNTSVCKNNGVCSSTAEYPYFKCACMSGFTGDNCDEYLICREKPCFNGGDCQVFAPTWRVCICKPGYEGDSCNVSTCPGDNCTDQVEINCLEFNSRSFVEFIPVPFPSVDELNVSISFRSLDNAGALLHIKDTATSRIMSLFLYRGRLQFRIMEGRKKLIFASTTRQSLSNKWFVANLLLSSSKVSVSISGNSSMRTKKITLGLLSSFNYTYFSLGGLRARNRQSSHDVTGFSGCISHVLVQDQLQDLRHAMTSSSSANVRTCQLDPCRGRCQAGEVCSVREMGHICKPISEP